MPLLSRRFEPVERRLAQTLAGRALLGAICGGVAAAACLVVGLVRASHAMLTNGLDLPLTGPDLLDGARFAAVYGLSFASAGMLIGIFFPLTRWTAGLFTVCILAGVSLMAGMAYRAGDWHGMQTFTDFGVWGLGTIFGTAGAWGAWRVRRARRATLQA
jgi:hypothetical protein